MEFITPKVSLHLIDWAGIHPEPVMSTEECSQLRLALRWQAHPCPTLKDGRVTFTGISMGKGRCSKGK
jgi:hypothetical protein